MTRMDGLLQGRSDDMDSGDRQDARLPKGDVENLLEEKTQALAETIKELEDSDAKNKQLLDKVWQLLLVTFCFVMGNGLYFSFCHVFFLLGCSCA